MQPFTTVIKPLDKQAAWFPQARFGVFAHFGLYSLLARGEWAMQWENIPVETYRKLMKRFNPTKFDAREWVDFVKRAGGRYFCVTAKHHDGFCLFDSKLTDYKSTNTPFGRDLIREVVDACHKAKLPIVLYYSQPDWAHPNYVRNTGFKDGHPQKGDRPDAEAYFKYYFGQVEELCTNYGRIDGIWFDGMNRSNAEWRGRQVYDLIKCHQPQAVVNDRAGYGDYYTPERKLATAATSLGYMVESVDSVCKGVWAWKPDAELRSSPSVVQALVRMAAANGNYLFNIGPKPDGSLPAEWAKRFEDVGDWLAGHGQSIYGTEGLPNREESADQLYTRSGKTLYLHLLQWPQTDRLTLRMLTKCPSRVKLIGSDAKLSTELVNGQVVLQGLPPSPPNAMANVVELRFSDNNYLQPTPPLPVPRPRKFDGVLPLAVHLYDAPGVFLSSKGLPLPTYAFHGKIDENISNIWRPEHVVRWKIDSARDCEVTVMLEAAGAANAHGSTFTLTLNGRELIGTMPKTKAWTEFTTVPIPGRLRLRKGRNTLTMVPKDIRVRGLFGVLRTLTFTLVASKMD